MFCAVGQYLAALNPFANREPNLLGDPRCPLDVLGHTLGYLPVETLAKCQLVCKRWLQLCENNPVFRQHINLAWAIARARAIPDPAKRAFVLMDMGITCATNRPQQAQALVNAGRDTLFHNQYRNAFLAKMQEFRQANAIESESSQFQTFIDCNQHEARSNPNAVIERAFNRHTSRPLFYKIRKEVIKIAAQNNHELTLESLRSLQKTFRDSQAGNKLLIEIIKIVAPTHPERAQEIAGLILNPPFMQGKALREIVRIIAPTHLGKAKEVARHIAERMNRARAFQEIVKIEAFTSPSAAKATAQSYVTAYREEIDEMLLEILKIELHNRSPTALETIELIVSPYYKACAHLEWAKNESKDLSLKMQHLDNLKVHLAPIENSSKCCLLFAEMVREEATINMKKALISANMFPKYRPQALLEVIRLIAPTDLQTARNLALSISPEFSRELALALLEIGKQSTFTRKFLALQAP